MQFLIRAILLFIVIDVLLVAFVVYRRTRKAASPKLVEEVQRQWKNIIRQKDQRHAIMDADKLLDYTLGKMGYTGSLGNKLKQAAGRFTSANNVWKAHKIRNNIAHQMNYHITEKVYKESMLYFKQAFKDLKIF